MKKLFAFTLICVMMLALAVGVSADVESDVVEIVPENFGANVAATTADDLTWENGTVTAVDIPLFGLQLPKPIQLGETVVVKIKGTSEGDFRVWLLGAGEKTFSNQYKMSENGFVEGAFEKTIELTASDFDSANLTEADNLCIKGAAYGVNIANLTIESVEIYYCSLDEFAQQVDTSEMDAKLTEAQGKLTELEGLVNDIDAFEEAVAALENEYLPYFEEMANIGVEAATDAYSELSKKVEELHGTAILNSLSDYIKTVEDAYAKAKESTDTSVLEECYNAAKEAADHVYGKSVLYDNARTKATELREMASEIKDRMDTILATGSGNNETAAATGAGTEAPDNGATEKKDEGGCGSTMSAAAIIISTAAVFGCAVIKRKH